MIAGSAPDVPDSPTPLAPSALVVVGSKHQLHARARARGARVDAEDFCVRAIGAEKMAVELSRKIPVGGVAAPAGQQALVFAAEGVFIHAAVCLRKIGRSVRGGRAGIWKNRSATKPR